MWSCKNYTMSGEELYGIASCMDFSGERGWAVFFFEEVWGPKNKSSVGWGGRPKENQVLGKVGKGEFVE